MAAVFVDYDGTITDLDTLDVLVQHGAGAEVWGLLETELTAGRLTLRETLERQASFVRLSLDEADAILCRTVRFDASFPAFATRCEQLGHELVVVSSGIAPLIRRALARHGVGHVALVANDVDVTPDGWRMRFASESANGTDKAALVHDARAGGAATVYIGDGWSDFAAAVEADVRFAKNGRALERYLRQRGLAFTPFAEFSGIDAHAFPAAT